MASPAGETSTAGSSGRGERAPDWHAGPELMMAFGLGADYGAPAVQRKGEGGGAADVHVAAQRGIAAGGQALPHGDAIQRSFGAHDVSDVRAHVGGAATAACEQIGATAYATGRDVAFSGSPDLHTAAHEAAHVVQQRAGVHLKGGVGEVGDAYERHADQVADLVVQGKSAEGLLDQMAGGGGGSSSAVQRAAVTTTSGVFTDEAYTPIVDTGKNVGVDIHLSFAPGDGVDAKKIGMVQSVKSMDQGAVQVMNEGDRGKLVPGGNAAGYKHDRAYGNNNPVYGAGRLPDGKGLDATPESNADPDQVPKVGGEDATATYILGHRYDDGGLKTRKAEMHDAPKLPERGANASQIFETTALALDGTDKNKYYGSVSWGWKTDGDGNFTQLPLTKVSDGNPSELFLEPAKQWNKYKIEGKIAEPDGSGNTTTTAAIEVKKSGTPFTVAAGTALNVNLESEGVGKEMLATLAKTIQLEDGGTYWSVWLKDDQVADGALKEDHTCKVKDKDVTISKGSKLKVTTAVVGESKLYWLKQAVLKDVDDGHLMVWIPKLELKGDKTVPLPIPGG